MSSTNAFGRCRAWFALIASSVLSFAAPTSHAQVCPFDDGNSSLAVEGLILTRYALGITGAPLVASTGINAVDAPAVEAAINCPSCGLNITGNPTLTVADATIISRKLAGFSGDALTNGVALGSGTRNTPAAVQSFLLSGCGATGGTVTSITAGSGLTGGTITGSGTIAVNTSVIQNRVSGTCAVGSSIRAIAVDGTVTCQTDTTGGSGTVTNVATGVGLTGGPVTTSGTIGLAATQLLPTTACANNQIPKWNGSAWLCATEAVGGTGTVTNVASGTGLSGGPITATGTLSIANPFRLPQSCVDGQIAKYNSNTQLWECATDNGGGGTVTNVGAGIGLNGGPVTTSGTLAIAPSFRLPQTCANGQFTRFNNTLNLWECVTPAVVTNVATGPGLTGGPITSTGTVNLASTQLLPTTACANGEIAKWNGSAWACAADASGAGGVTSVATGPGLSGGPITSTGTVSLAATQLLPTTACTTDQIIRWNGSAWVCASSLLTLPSACLSGQFLTVASTGSVRCASLPPTLSVGYTATTNPLNAFNGVAVAIGLDGLPVIAFISETKTLVVLKCGNVPCNSGNTLNVADASGFVSNTSLAIAVPTDGNPIISYAHEPSVVSRSLRVVKCGNALCSSGNVITTVDSTVAQVGSKSAIAISPADQLPVISYFSQTDAQVKVAKCGNAACNSGNTLTLVGAASNSTTTSIAVRANGNPWVTYNSGSAWLALNCGNAQCSSGNLTPSFDTVAAVGASAIAIPPDGIPVVAYGIFSLFTQLKVAKCGNADCSSGNTYTTVDPSLSSNGPVLAMTISADGFPIIIYRRSGINDTAKLFVQKCGNASCSSGNIVTHVTAAVNHTVVGAIAVPADGLPVITYQDTASTPDSLRILKCSDVGCGNP